MTLQYNPKTYGIIGADTRDVDADFGIPSPAPVDMDPERDVQLYCGPCDLSVIVPVGDLLSGKAQRELPKCSRDVCACKIVAQETAASTDTPATSTTSKKASTKKASASTAETTQTDATVAGDTSPTE